MQLDSVRLVTAVFSKALFRKLELMSILTRKVYVWGEGNLKIVSLKK
jgi:hypothetical protein